jgi:hypothetical protein
MQFAPHGGFRPAGYRVGALKYTNGLCAAQLVKPGDRLTAPWPMTDAPKSVK